jgi:hypothetical protein
MYFFYFVHRLNYKIIKQQRFGSWILLLSSGRKGEKDLGTGLKLAQLESPMDRLPPFLFEDGSRIQLPKRSTYFHNFII